MAPWWYVASTEPVSLQRIAAAALLGLLLFASVDPLWHEWSIDARLSWCAGALLSGCALAATFWRRRRRGEERAAPTLAIDSAAALYRIEGDEVVPFAPAELKGWRLGPWQFIASQAPRALAVDRRRTDPQAWAALQRALVRARRRRTDALEASAPRTAKPDGGS